MPQREMHAVRIHKFGGPEVLEVDKIAVPDPGPGEVLVRVRAAGVNPPDWYVREGLPDVPPELLPPIDLPVVLGTDLSGTIEAVADDVRSFTMGDEVFGMVRFPEQLQGSTYAQYAVTPASDLAMKPSTLSHRAAAAAPMAALTAWQYLIAAGHDHPSPFQSHLHEPVTLGPESVVAINGAAGGVGHLAVQIAKWKGAHVIAIASSSHEQFLRDLGADEFIDYTKQTPEAHLRNVDLILDTVGGPDSRRFLRSLKRGGALFPVYFAEFDDEEVRTLGVRTSVTQVRASGEQLSEIASLLRDGTLRTMVQQAFPLAEAHAAHTRASQGHLQGKLVLDVD